MTIIEDIISCGKDYIMFEVCMKEEDIKFAIETALAKGFHLICVSNAGIKTPGVRRLTFEHESILKENKPNA